MGRGGLALPPWPILEQDCTASPTKTALSLFRVGDGLWTGRQDLQLSLAVLSFKTYLQCSDDD
jgi:hypothetical protein